MESLNSHVIKHNFWLEDDSAFINSILGKKTSQAEIPKLIHFIWLGPKPLPPTFELIKQQWVMHHSDYQIKLWTEADLTDLELTNRDDICDFSLNPALRADFLRLEILYLFGGIYADVDMTCERPLDDLLTKCSFIAGIANTQAFEVNNGLMLSTKHNKLVRMLIEEIKISLVTEKHNLANRIAKESSVIQILKMVDPVKAHEMVKQQQLNVLACSGPGFLTKALQRHEDCEFLVLPYVFFYPISNQQRHGLTF